MSSSALCQVEPEVFDHSLTLEDAAAETLMPFHLRTDAEGRVTYVGPTLAKLLGEEGRGQRLFDLIEVHRPTGTRDFETLKAAAGQKLTLFVKGQPDHALKGVGVVLSDGGVLVNISLGLHVEALVAELNLGQRDFSPADPTVEMLYLFAIQKVLKSASESLNRRLQGDKTMAEKQAFTDSLTGLANRRALEKHMDRMLSRRRKTAFGLMQIDLDFFKQVNDTYGHAAGDYVLKTVADRLINAVRPSDLVARIGGDEFVVALLDAPSPELLDSVANRIIARAKDPIPFEDVVCQIGASIGGTLVAPGTDIDAAQLLSDADEALYASKSAGRGRYTYFEKAPVGISGE